MVEPISYTSRDFETILEALKNRVKSKFPNTWKDFVESDVGYSILEVMAYVFDVLSYYLDVMANEAFLPTARDRDSVILLCKLIGYRLRGPTSAVVPVRFSIESALDKDVLIPKGTLVSTDNNVEFELLEDAYILAGNTYVDAEMSEGRTIVDERTSDGTRFQEFKLSRSPLIHGSVSVTVDGVEWKQVESLVYATDTSLCYEVSTDADDYGYVKFGDGVSGAIPPHGSTISISYRIGGGLKGNIDSDEISSYVTGVLSLDPYETIQVHVESTDRGSGGLERESIEHAKYWAPKWVVANGRAVTSRDFDTLGTLYNHPVYGSPFRVKAVLKQRVPECNTVVIYVWSKNSEGDVVPPSSSLKNALYEYFNNNGEGAVRIITVDCEVEDGTNLYVYVDALVRAKEGWDTFGVMSEVEGAIREYFDSVENQPGVDVDLGKLYVLAHKNVKGLDALSINQVYGALETSEVVAVGDGGTKSYEHNTFQFPIVPKTLVITAGDLVVEDDGAGKLVGDVDPNELSQIDYYTGEVKWSFSSAVEEGVQIQVTYRYVADRLCNEELNHTTDGVTKRFRGYISNPPIVPGSFSISDSVQAALDDGVGNLTGDVDSEGVNRIDYSSGFYDVTFRYAPADLTISTIYRQRLQVKTGSLWLEDNQLAVVGQINVGIL